jgi:hypothetical protein
MKSLRAVFCILVLISISADRLNGQVINGTNLLDYQFGKIPDDTLAFSGLYNRTQAQFSMNNLRAGITLEQYHTPVPERNYLKLTQFSLRYQSEKLEVSLGHFAETLGRGLLLRSFEIPGAVLEDLSYRSRHYFHRDLLGVVGKYQVSKNFSVKALYGQPLNYLFPPNQDDMLRRPDIIEAINPEFSIGRQLFGAAMLRVTNSSETSVYAMVNASGSLFPFLSYYIEMAKDADTYALSDFSGEVPFALYGSMNMSLGSLGVSLEYKKYNNFLLGAGFNEPPALVKEHSYRVLNRSTHVLQPDNETGYQIEAFYSFPDFSMLTFNHTIAINEFGRQFIFREYFLEYDFKIRGDHHFRLFADYAEDPFKLEENRISAGAYIEWNISPSHLLNTYYEYQTFDRTDNQVYNHVAVLGLTLLPKLAINLTAEMSNDPFLVENDFRTWLGGNLRYHLNNRNTLQLFAGQRRGGPACNAGICYEVLDFEGMEVRLTSRF